MPSLQFDALSLPIPRLRRCKHRIWREWCFAKTALRHFRVRFLIMGLVLLTGAGLFGKFGSDEGFSIGHGVFNTWKLILGELPDEPPPLHKPK